MQKQYRKRSNKTVTAVQIRLVTSGLKYRKWGTEQIGKPGDWLVDNGGDVYTVDRDTFSRTYERARTGQYRKITTVWASEATEAGVIRTKEGKTHYRAGDFIVANDETDAHAVAREAFLEMYEVC